MLLQVPQMDDHYQDALFKAMAEPDFYPHPVQQVVQKETHISKVFLTGDFVYKVKKPVDLGFLDFTSLEKRQHICEMEVALNRRLTDDIYLDVLPITLSGDQFSLAGPGTVVEFAVRMRQLPDDRSLAVRLEQDAVTREDVKALAVKLADFYAQQGRLSPELAAASWENIKYACEENFRQTAWAVGNVLDSRLYQKVQTATRSFLAHCKALFNSRSDSGKICDGHGDLRCGHIYYTGKNNVQIIDCIEFNTRFRYIDMASDLAFLAMDLDFNGAAALGSHLVDTYTRRTGDWQLYALLPFYKCYRAMVRCKVNCILMKEINQKANRPSGPGGKAERYLSLAHQYAQQFGKPTLWVLCGLPAAGKSTIARILSKTMLIDTLRSDVIRKQLFGENPEMTAIAEFEQGVYSPDASGRTYGKMLELAREALHQNRSIVLDATFSRAEQRRQVIQLAIETHSRALFVECTAPDGLLKERLLQRESNPSVSDARAHHFEMLKQRYVTMNEVDQTLQLQMDTTQPIEECIATILSWGHMAF